MILGQGCSAHQKVAVEDYLDVVSIGLGKPSQLTIIPLPFISKRQLPEEVT
jgi:hypothetical protein